MATTAKMRWIKVAAAAAVAAIVVASLLPANWQLRTGLPWQIKHFLAYFTVTSSLCLAFLRPPVVTLGLMTFAGLLEALLRPPPPDRAQCRRRGHVVWAPGHAAGQALGDTGSPGPGPGLTKRVSPCADGYLRARALDTGHHGRNRRGWRSTPRGAIGDQH